MVLLLAFIMYGLLAAISSFLILVVWLPHPSSHALHRLILFEIFPVVTKPSSAPSFFVPFFPCHNRCICTSLSELKARNCTPLNHVKFSGITCLTFAYNADFDCIIFLFCSVTWFKDNRCFSKQMLRNKVMLVYGLALT